MMDIKEQIADYGVNNDAPDLTAERNSNGVNLPTSMEEQINKPIQNTYESEISISPKKRKEDYIDSEDFKAKPVYEFFKRFFDIVLSVLASVVLLIPILVIAVIIMYKDSGNPFYLHTRVGRHHKQIKILKFRSMRIGADSLEDMLTQEDLEYECERYGGYYPVADFACAECGKNGVSVRDDFLPIGKCCYCGYENEVNVCERCGTVYDDSGGNKHLCNGCLPQDE